MKHLKRILSVLLLISLIPLLPLTVGADEESGSATAPQTVYVSAEGNDETAAIGDRTKPYADFLTAYGELTATGGTVVLLNDVTVDLTTPEYTAVSAAHRFKLPASDKAIAICGLKQIDEKYSKLTFKNTTGVCAELQGDVTFYDLTIGFTTDKSGANLWLAANGYNLTIGFNFTLAMTNAKGNIVGGAQGTVDGASIVPMNTKYGPTIKIFSGVWDRIRANSFVNVALKENCNLFLYGGSFASVNMLQNKNHTACNGATVHYFGGTITQISGLVPTGKTSTLILYNGAELGVTPSSAFTTTTTATAPLPAPDYALNFYGTQVTTPNEGKYSVRFVGTLNSLDYSAVGLLIRTENAEYGGCCEKVYTSILGNFERYTAEQLGGNYIFTWTIQNIPENAGSVTFTVTPFLATGDTVWYGQVSTVTYQAGILQ